MINPLFYAQFLRFFNNQPNSDQILALENFSDFIADHAHVGAKQRRARAVRNRAAAKKNVVHIICAPSVYCFTHCATNAANSLTALLPMLLSGTARLIVRLDGGSSGSTFTLSPRPLSSSRGIRLMPNPPANVKRVR